MRFVLGGIHIEGSTYTRIRNRSEALSAAASSTSLGSYPHPFLPTLYANAVRGGPVERATYDAFKGEFIQPLKELLPLDGLYLPTAGDAMKRPLLEVWTKGVDGLLVDAG
jgi:microcystin degradation protein MlrC